MSENAPKGPVCSKCGHNEFNDIPIMEFNMMFVCCEKCGEVIAHRDYILLDKLDHISEALNSFQQDS